MTECAGHGNPSPVCMQQVIVDGLATDRATTSGDVMSNDTNCTRTRFLNRYAKGSGAVDIDVICVEAK